MTAVVAPDGPLVQARRRLEDAVAALVDPVPVAADGGYRWSPALYAELRAGLAGRHTTRRTPGWRSQAPLRLEVLALLIEIDQTVAHWQPDGKGTVERLRAITARGWRPQDCDALDGYTATLQRGVLDATAMLAPEVRV